MTPADRPCAKDSLRAHPGEFLLIMLRDKGWSQADLVRKTNRGLSPTTINEIVQGRTSVSERTARILAEAIIGTTPTFWLTLQQMYDRSIVHRDEWLAAREAQQRPRHDDE